MVFSSEFGEDISQKWRDYLTRTGAKVVYWKHPELDEYEYDNPGELCPVKDILLEGELLKQVFI